MKIYQLISTFQATFDGTRYRHRNSRLGDDIAMRLYEDLFALGISSKYNQRVIAHKRVLNVENKRRGIRARRGDGTFGELIPNARVITDHGFSIARGPVATVEIGVEVKILAKAMIKQIDRVIGDLKKQVDHFNRGGGNPLCLGIVGVNHARVCTGYEGERSTTTDGRAHKHPYQEAAEAEMRLNAEARAAFDEFLVLRYCASNVEPYPFEWVDYDETVLDYGVRSRI